MTDMLTIDEANELISQGPGEYRSGDLLGITHGLGAPAAVRAAVSVAGTPLDELTVLGSYYDDENVRPYGAGNYLIRDKNSGELFLYNEDNPEFFGVPVPTIGDVISVGPEVGEFAGGVAGGSLGALLTGTSGGAGSVAIPAAVGAGAIAGREGVSRLMRLLMGVPDSRGPVEQAQDVATTFALNAGGQAAADAVIRGVGQLVPPIRRWRGGVGHDPTEALADFARLGTRPLAGAVTGSPGVQATERAISSMPGGVGPFARAIEETRLGLERAFDRIGGAVAAGGGRNPAGRVPRGPQSIGRAAQDAMGRTVAPYSTAPIPGAAGRFAATRQGMDDEALRRIGPETVAQTPALQGLADEMRQSIVASGGEVAPNGIDILTYGNRPDLRGAYEAVADVLEAGAHAPRGGMSFRELRGQRTQLGADLDAPDVTGYAGRRAAPARRLYGAMAEDMRTTARGVSREAENALLLHDDFVRHWRTVEYPTISRLLSRAGGEPISPEQTYRVLRQNINEGGSVLQAVRRNATPEEWDEIAGGMWQMLGRATPGAREAGELGEMFTDFSFSTFRTNWERLSPEAKQSLFGGSRYAGVVGDMDALVRVVNRINQGARYENVSRTGISTGVQIPLFAALGMVATGNIRGAAGFALGGAVVPGVTSRLLQSPRFINWLARAPTEGNIGAHLGRLAVIAEAEPEVRDVLGAYLTGVETLHSGQITALTDLYNRSRGVPELERGFDDLIDRIGYREEFERVLQPGAPSR